MIYDEWMRLHETCVNNNNNFANFIYSRGSALALARVDIVIAGIRIQIHERAPNDFVGEKSARTHTPIVGRGVPYYVCDDVFFRRLVRFTANKFL